MRKRTMSFGPRVEPEEQETPPIRAREVSDGPFAAGWVTTDGKLQGEPPLLRTGERRARD